MDHKKFWAAAGKVMAATTMMLVVVLMLVPGARAQGHYKTLYKFTGGADGNYPLGLVLDAAGNLYGATGLGGGAYGGGTVFKIDADGTMSVLYNFTGGADGGGPALNTLTLDSVGNLYGTTYGGGAYGVGTVFEVDTNGVETVLYSFCPGGNPCPDGARPTGGVIFDQAGNLYGTTCRGGNYYGVLFKLTPNLGGTWTETVLHSFPAYSGDAAEAYAGLSWDVAGNLYGATWQGGAYGLGTIFKYDTNGNESLVHSFTGTDGAHLYRPPIFDSAGNLYDTPAFGGDYSCPSPVGGCGTVVKLDTSGNVTVLYTFHGGKDGAFPFTGLTFDQAGNFYGAAQVGGAYGYGTVFMGTIGQGGKVKGRVIHTFANRPGAEPGYAMVIDTKGNLYGTTDGDGVTTFGSVFEITP